MSNHVRVVVGLLPEVAPSWSDDEIAARWTRLYRRRDQDDSIRAAALAGNTERIKVLRERLSDLSWFMRCLSEPISRRANQEDGCKGHFTDGRYAGFCRSKKPAWEARFKSQLLLVESAVLAAMTYVDLNPVRAKLSVGVVDSTHTSACKRLQQLDAEPADYLALVDRTGRQFHPGKRGVIDGPPLLALRQLGYSEQSWTRQVLGVGHAYPRAITQAEGLLDKAKGNWPTLALRYRLGASAGVAPGMRRKYGAIQCTGLTHYWSARWRQHRTTTPDRSTTPDSQELQSTRERTRTQKSARVPLP